MIKFGSRTDVVVPEATPIDVRVAVGDKVRAGETVLGRFE
jgi:phosphatidylserine decarboxylase